ncbi:LOW QUALITY PROTEIN: TIGD4-like protein, partial [Mya arenaria]
EKLKPVVIGKATKSLCFWSIFVDKLLVKYYSNKTAWMHSWSFEDWIKSLVMKMRTANIHILLFVDNAPVHPDITLRSVKLMFFPKNCTSPMDTGIIQMLKLKYRKRHVLGEMERNNSQTGPEILRVLNILQAIYWFNSSLNEKCFRKCGFGDNISSRTSQHMESGQDSDDVNKDDVHWLLSRNLFSQDFSTLADIDSNVHTCDNTMTNWGRHASDILTDVKNSVETTSNQDDDDED